MKGYLDTIIERKKIEVQQLKKSNLVLEERSSKTASLITILRNSGDVKIIAEFKRSSPSKGDLNIELDPVSQAGLYAASGAAAISVLTDEVGFKGSFSDLKNVRKTVMVPILCKDFIIDKIQIDLAYSAGADLILLIAAVLNHEELIDLYSYANAKGMECLVEIHDLADLEKAMKIDSELIGINNRDLKSFEVNLKNTEELGPLVKKSGRLLVSESGIRNRDDVLRAAGAGADAVLIGEALMVSGNAAATFEHFKMTEKVERNEG